MQFEKSFVNNYIYNENSEPIVGGLPIRTLFNENIQLDTKFDNMSIPIGLVMEKSIHKMNGYHPHEIIGKTPKIFQGELTSEISRTKIKNALLNQLPFKEIIVNYKKDGTTYLCEIEAFPKFNKKGELLNYIAFERIAS